MRIFMIGASGTAGHATAQGLIDAGHDVVCFLRLSSTLNLPGATRRNGDVNDLGSLQNDGFRGENFDAVVSCLASRSGTPTDAWLIDHKAHMNVLEAAKNSKIQHFVLMSAICVQKPKLAFQHAKLAFETALITSGLNYSIVRPTALFKSLSGQLDRLRAGKPFLVFGDGALTACKPISDADLGRFMADCLTDKTRHNRILPIGGPGPAITPRDQAKALFEMLGQEPRIRHVPVAVMGAIVTGLSIAGRAFPNLAAKADFARIGHYYATESMLVWDGTRYEADATPETGRDTLFDYYRTLIEQDASAERGDHSVF
ncbi:NAD(P)H-binding protein [Pseudosulfitobacter sp. SM2401]|uniref:NAD(P)H-binding protein n=1 Tax=Pseudosulfitobacter sp. SM2401 TaxID=3350098 RepID=UPI0036F1F102